MNENGLLNGASGATIRTLRPKTSVDAEQLQMLERSASALGVLSTGNTKMQALALKVAKGELSADAAWTILGILG